MTKFSTKVISKAKGISKGSNQSTNSLSSKITNGIKNSKDVITKRNSKGEMVPYAKQFKISDDYKIILRRDIGEFSHGLADHYNLELQTKAGNIKYNLHLFINEAKEIIKIKD